MSTLQTSALSEQLYARYGSDPVTRELIPILTSETGQTSSGYPFLQPPVWRRLRDWVPHILASGPQVLGRVGSGSASTCCNSLKELLFFR